MLLEVGILSLAVAAVADYRHRSVPNRYFIPLYLAGLIQLALAIQSGPLSAIGLHVGLAALLSLGPWLLGAYGGADAKALLGLGLVLVNVWLLAAISLGAIVLTIAWYAPRVWPASVRPDSIEAPFLVPVFTATVGVLLLVR